MGSLRFHSGHGVHIFFSQEERPIFAPHDTITPLQCEMYQSNHGHEAARTGITVGRNIDLYADFGQTRILIYELIAAGNETAPGENGLFRPKPFTFLTGKNETRGRDRAREPCVLSPLLKF